MSGHRRCRTSTFLVAGVTASLAMAIGCRRSQPSPGSGSSGGAAGGQGDSASDWPAGLQSIIDSLPNLLSGGATDLHGDGSADVTTNIVNGIRMQHFLGGSGQSLTVTYSDSSHVSAWGDLNGDGATDYVDSITIIADAASEQAEWDTDFDGTFDERLTRVIDFSRWTYEQTIERWRGIPPAWVTVDSSHGADFFADGGDHLSDCAIPGVNFPSQPDLSPASAPLNDGTPEFDESHTVHVATGSGPGGCTPEEASRIGRALRNAVLQGLLCLDNENIAMSAQLADALAGRNIVIGCGYDPPPLPGGIPLLGCAGGAISWYYPGTKIHSPGWPIVYPINLNIALLADDATLQRTILHELLHAAGVPAGGDHDSGTDSIYSCARYCSGCSTSDKGGGDPAADCARCADDPLAKGFCGYQKMRFTSDCAQAPDPYCWGDIGHVGPNQYLCASCVYDQDRFCDGSPMAPLTTTDWECCASCPGPSNRYACQNAPPESPQLVTACGRPAGCP